MARRSKSQLEAILIDRAAAAEQPSEEAVRGWGREKRTFMSSVMSELRDERRAVADRIRAVGLRPVMFEEFGGRDADPATSTRTTIREQCTPGSTGGRGHLNKIEEIFSVSWARED